MKNLVLVKIGNPAFTMEEIKKFWKKLVKAEIQFYEFLFYQYLPW